VLSLMSGSRTFRVPSMKQRKTSSRLSGNKTPPCPLLPFDTIAAMATAQARHVLSPDIAPLTSIKTTHITQLMKELVRILLLRASGDPKQTEELTINVISCVIERLVRPSFLQAAD